MRLASQVASLDLGGELRDLAGILCGYSSELRDLGSISLELVDLGTKAGELRAPRSRDATLRKRARPGAGDAPPSVAPDTPAFVRTPLRPSLLWLSGAQLPMAPGRACLPIAEKGSREG